MIAVVLAIVFGVIVIAVIAVVAVFVTREQIDVRQDAKSLIGSEFKSLGVVSGNMPQQKIDCFVDNAMDQLTPEQQVGVMGGMCTLFSMANEGAQSSGKDDSGVVPPVIPPVCQKYLSTDSNIMGIFTGGISKCGVSEEEMGDLGKIFPKK